MYKCWAACACGERDIHKVKYFIEWNKDRMLVARMFLPLWKIRAVCLPQWKSTVRARFQSRDPNLSPLQVGSAPSSISGTLSLGPMEVSDNVLLGVVHPAQSRISSSTSGLCPPDAGGALLHDCDN